MSLAKLGIVDFRCIESAALDLDERCNLIYGGNGSGKTSLLEAIGFLSRGRSIRGTRTDGLIKHGCKSFRLTAMVSGSGLSHRLGVEWKRGSEPVFRIDGVAAGGMAALAEKLPVQVIDPEIHRLVADGPEVRRRFLDYGVFHVEQGFLDAWRRYRRALRQRNAALRQGLGNDAVEAWNPELIVAGDEVDERRRRHAKQLDLVFRNIASELMDEPAACEYRPGWGDAAALAEALESSRGRDREQGTTTVGPHRAELRLAFRERAARAQVSRGQQKMFAAALVLAQTRLLADKLPEPPLLLVDDPAAELDREALDRLLSLVRSTTSQLIITALSPEALQLPTGKRMFHVEQGQFVEVAGHG